MSRVAVVGGGIAGLAAAWELASRGEPELEVVVLEASPVLGGKLRTASVAGHLIDVGAESMLARRPEGLTLLQEAGLEDLVVHPTGAAATIWSRGRRWPLPARTLMGVPSEPDSALGLLDRDEVARVRAEVATPPPESDVSVGDFVEARLGPAVVDRLVEPLLAGVYAGHSRSLSLQACVPALWTAARRGESLVATAARAATKSFVHVRDSASPASAASEASEASADPVFAGYRGGLGAMVGDLVLRLTATGMILRTDATVRALERTLSGWALTLGPTNASERVEVDAVVLATPAAAAARLLAPHAPYVASSLAEVDYASMAIVTLALPRHAVSALTVGSGVLVPPTEPLTIKAATFSSTKWDWVDHLDPDVVFVRTSIGRAGETADLQRDDADLVRRALDELGVVVRARLPRPVDSHVQRWGGALPQYAVGHVDRVDTVLRAVGDVPGLEVAGAVYGGVGVPATIGSGRAAAARVLTHLRGVRV